MDCNCPRTVYEVCTCTASSPRHSKPEQLQCKLYEKFLCFGTIDEIFFNIKLFPTALWLCSLFSLAHAFPFQSDSAPCSGISRSYYKPGHLASGPKRPPFLGDLGNVLEILHFKVQLVSGVAILELNEYSQLVISIPIFTFVNIIQIILILFCSYLSWNYFQHNAWNYYLNTSLKTD